MRSIATVLGSALILAFTTCICSAATLVKVSSDPFTNSASQHRTEVEPDTFSYGTTIVSAFQTGRVIPGGSADIGWATSTDGGTTWNSGFLPGITKAQNPGNRYDAVSDPSVGYDAAHAMWLIASLPLSNTRPTSPAIFISRSPDGLTWAKPVGIAPRTQSADKPWVVCDDWTTSKFYGNCYAEWDSPAAGDEIFMNTSRDGGANWLGSLATVNQDAGLGGQPIVLPNGRVVVPFEGFNGIESFTSTDGGKHWSGAQTVTSEFFHSEAAGLRSSPLPSAAQDASGRIYVAWPDCRFRSNCTENDIVYTTSTNGTTWSAPVRVPIDSVTSTVDHFIPGIGIQPATSGATADIGLTFYFFPNSNCSTATCQLGVGFVSSHNGGSTWNTAQVLAGPMKVGWLANSQNGLMVADYIATAFVSDLAFSVFAVANKPAGGLFNEAMYAPAGGMAIPQFGPQLTAASDRAYLNPRFKYHWRPLPPKAKRSASKEGR
jgi:hypothetical protein